MNRVLLCGPQGFDKVEYVKKVFSIDILRADQITIPPETEGDSQSGIILENLPLSTKYYDAEIGVFIDEPDTNEVCSYIRWMEELCMEEMIELREELQMVVLVFPAGLEDEYEAATREAVETMAGVFDAEHVGRHVECLQWDGEVFVGAAGGELRRAVECVEWRALRRRGAGPLTPAGEAGEADGKLETALAADVGRLRAARGEREKRGSSSDKDLTVQEKELVDGIVARLFQDPPESPELQEQS